MEEGFEVESRIEPPEESHPHWLIAAISVTTALLAVSAAYSSLLAGQSAHHSLAALNEAAISQNKASDQWNFYQAKGIKRHVFETQRDALRLQPGDKPAALAARYHKETTRYLTDQKGIQHEAERYEAEVKAQEGLAQRYDERYQKLALAVAFLQIGIVVSSVAAIVRRTPVWYLGLLGGVVGVFFLLQVMLTPAPGLPPGPGVHPGGGGGAG